MCQNTDVIVYYYRTYEKAVSGGEEREKGGHVLAPKNQVRLALGPPLGTLVFGGFAFPPVSLGPAGDCPCKD